MVVFGAFGSPGLVEDAAAGLPMVEESSADPEHAPMTRLSIAIVAMSRITTNLYALVRSMRWNVQPRLGDFTYHWPVLAFSFSFQLW